MTSTSTAVPVHDSDEGIAAKAAIQAASMPSGLKRSSLCPRRQRIATIWGLPFRDPDILRGRHDRTPPSVAAEGKQGSGHSFLGAPAHAVARARASVTSHNSLAVQGHWRAYQPLSGLMHTMRANHRTLHGGSA